MKGKSLIGGVEQEGKRIYPPDWPCKACGRAWKVHVKKGEPSYDKSPWLDNWCWGRIKGSDKLMENQLKKLLFFIPVDNLSYIEIKAKSAGKLNKRNK